MLRSMFRKYTNMHVLSICNGSNHGSEMRSCGLLVHIDQEEIKTHQIIYIWLNWISKRPTIDLKFNTPYTYVYIYIYIHTVYMYMIHHSPETKLTLEIKKKLLQNLFWNSPGWPNEYKLLLVKLELLILQKVLRIEWDDDHLLNSLPSLRR